MIYLFSGNDYIKKQEAINLFLQDKKDLEILYFDDSSFSENSFLEEAFGAGLFLGKKAFILNGILSSHGKNFILSIIKSLSDSENIFIFSEEILNKEIYSVISKFIKKEKSFDILKSKNAEKFNIFSITDAFGQKDKRKVWVLLQKAIKEGISFEEILNILIWQVKNIILVKNSKDIKKTGLAPFVFQKTKKFADNFKDQELKDISRDLVSLFHESHLGLDLSSSLELFILKKIK